MKASSHPYFEEDACKPFIQDEGGQKRPGPHARKPGEFLPEFKHIKTSYFLDESKTEMEIRFKKKLLITEENIHLQFTTLYNKMHKDHHDSLETKVYNDAVKQFSSDNYFRKTSVQLIKPNYKACKRAA